MPTATYFNLPAQKRKTLMDAIHKELMRVPYEEVSINKIVQSAGISRGSFYQYFSGKEDMYEFIAAGFRTQIENFAKETLIAHQGDPFLLCKDILQAFFDFAPQADEMFSWVRNLLSGLKVKDERVNCIPFAIPDESKKTFFALIDTGQFNLKDENDMLDMAEIMISQLKWAIVEFVNNPGDQQKIMSRFENKLTILRCGMVKN